MKSRILIFAALLQVHFAIADEAIDATGKLSTIAQEGSNRAVGDAPAQISIGSSGRAVGDAHTHA